ncbi:MAG TPA: hypothetical protein VH092_20470 [Urbifossiella sp.]|nr:hypothetical protein [Urbifossiella sp.]
MRTCSAVAVLVLAATGQAQQPGKGVFQPPELVRWEYAELSSRTTTAFAKEGEDRSKSTLTLRWTTDKDETSFKSWAEFAKHIKAEVKEDGTTTLQRIQVLNCLGNQGWEMAESGGTAIGATTRTMLFKRRVR